MVRRAQAEGGGAWTSPIRNADVAVVIPALNESTVIGEVIAGVRAHFPLVILVDDGSQDATATSPGPRAPASSDTA